MQYPVTILTCRHATTFHSAAFIHIRAPFLGHRLSPKFKSQTVVSQATVAKDVLAQIDVGFTVNPRRFRKATKQVATLGPASSTLEMIEKLFLSGADIFRLNFSHGEHAEKLKLIRIIRVLERKYNHPIAILADLQGPKQRVGIFADTKVHLKDGQSFSFDLKDVAGNSQRVRLPHPEILHTLKVGDTLLLDDGKLRMVVTSTTMGDIRGSGHSNSGAAVSAGIAALCETAVDIAAGGLAGSALHSEGSVTCEVVVGGTLSNKKGVNTPSIVLPISPLTPKDRR